MLKWYPIFSLQRAELEEPSLCSLSYAHRREFSLCTNGHTLVCEVLWVLA